MQPIYGRVYSWFDLLFNVNTRIFYIKKVSLTKKIECLSVFFNFKCTHCQCHTFNHKGIFLKMRVSTYEFQWVSVCVCLNFTHEPGQILVKSRVTWQSIELKKWSRVRTIIRVTSTYSSIRWDFSFAFFPLFPGAWSTGSQMAELHCGKSLTCATGHSFLLFVVTKGNFYPKYHLENCRVWIWLDCKWIVIHGIEPTNQVRLNFCTSFHFTRFFYFHSLFRSFISFHFSQLNMNPHLLRVSLVKHTFIVCISSSFPFHFSMWHCQEEEERIKKKRTIRSFGRFNSEHA